MLYHAWLNRPKTVRALLLISFLLSFMGIAGIRIGPVRGSSRYISIIIRHGGRDSRSISRTICIPMEEAVAEIPGIEEFYSITEDGVCGIICKVSLETEPEEVYLLLREASNAVYRSFPRSVRKPVLMYGSDRSPVVFILAFEPPPGDPAEIRRLFERIKAGFRKIEGVGEVLMGGLPEASILVTVDHEESVLTGLVYADAAGEIEEAVNMYPLGEISLNNRMVPVLLPSQISTPEDILKLTPSSAGNTNIPLHRLAGVRYEAGAKESISRINGREKIVLYIRSTDEANIISLSGALRAETGLLEAEGLSPVIILDTGEDLRRAVSSLILAVCFGLSVSSLFLWLFLKARAALVVLSVAGSLFFTLGILSAAGVTINRYVLAGLTLGTGFLFDSGIIVTSVLPLRASDDTYIRELKRIVKPLVYSCLTTIAALVPLFASQVLVPGAREIALSLVILLAGSLFFSLLFLPPLMKQVKPAVHKDGRIPGRLYGTLMKVLPRMWEKRRTTMVITFMLGITGMIFLAVIGKDIHLEFPGAFIRCRVEFEQGLAAEETDRRIMPFLREVQSVNGVEIVESRARRGSADITCMFDPAVITRDRTARYLAEGEELIREGSLFIRTGRSGRTRSLEVSLLGPDIDVLREETRNISRILSGYSWTSSIVYHFKDPGNVYRFSIDPEAADSAGVFPSDIGTALRWIFYSPAAAKWITPGGERDIRLTGKTSTTLTPRTITSLSIPGRNGNSVPLRFLGTLTLIRRETRMFRKNGEPALSFSLFTEELPFGSLVQKTVKVLQSVKLPQGYRMEIGSEMTRFLDQLRTLRLSVLLAVVLVYMLLASSMESLVLPFYIMPGIPVSLSFPLIALYAWGKNLVFSSVLGLIILSGLVVNNSIIILDDLRGGNPDGLHRALGKRLKPLILTTATSILGVIPLLASPGDTGEFAFSLGFVIFWGMIGSLFYSLLVLPVMLGWKNRFYRGRIHHRTW